MAFATLMMFQMFNVLNCRSQKESAFKIGIFSNNFILIAILSSVLLQIAAVHTPLRFFFKTVSLDFLDRMISIVVSSSVPIIGEVLKIISRNNPQS